MEMFIDVLLQYLKGEFRNWCKGKLRILLWTETQHQYEGTVGIMRKLKRKKQNLTSKVLFHLLYN